MTDLKDFEPPFSDTHPGNLAVAINGLNDAFRELQELSEDWRPVPCPPCPEDEGKEPRYTVAELREKLDEWTNSGPPKHHSDWEFLDWLESNPNPQQ